VGNFGSYLKARFHGVGDSIIAYLVITGVGAVITRATANVELIKNLPMAEKLLILLAVFSAVVIIAVLVRRAYRSRESSETEKQAITINVNPNISPVMTQSPTTTNVNQNELPQQFRAFRPSRLSIHDCRIETWYQSVELEQEQKHSKLGQLILLEPKQPEPRPYRIIIPAQVALVMPPEVDAFWLLGDELVIGSADRFLYDGEKAIKYGRGGKEIDITIKLVGKWPNEVLYAGTFELLLTMSPKRKISRRTPV
jgi:hypothetical protein